MSLMALSGHLRGTTNQVLLGATYDRREPASRRDADANTTCSRRCTSARRRSRSVRRLHVPDHAILGHTVTAAEIGARIAEQHPLSAIFPAMTAADFAQLRADIAANGLRQPIIIYDGQVLDGWHRYRACSETGTEILAEAFTGDDRAAQDFVLSANLARRHLTTSDRAIIAAKLATLGRGEKKSQMTPLRPLTIGEAAERVRVSAGSVTRARKVLARGTPELIERVESNDLSISAASLLLPPPPAQPRVVVEGVIPLSNGVRSLTTNALRCCVCGTRKRGSTARIQRKMATPSIGHAGRSASSPAANTIAHIVT